MDNFIAAIELALLIIFPLIIFYQNTNKSYKLYILYIVLLYLMWFVTYALLHELCHVFGSWITGAKIKDYQLMPQFWKGDFKTGYVHADFENGFQSFISPLSPYLRDLIFLFIGYSMLIRKKNRQFFYYWSGHYFLCFKPSL